MKNKTIYDLCEEYLSIYAPEECDLLELNYDNILNMYEEGDNKYTDSFASGIGMDIVLPSLIFVLATISSLIIKDGYEVTKKRIKEYLDKPNNKLDLSEIEKSKDAKIIVINIINVINSDKRGSEP